MVFILLHRSTKTPLIGKEGIEAKGQMHRESFSAYLHVTFRLLSKLLGSFMLSFKNAGQELFLQDITRMCSVFVFCILITVECTLRVEVPASGFPTYIFLLFCYY